MITDEFLIEFHRNSANGPQWCFTEKSKVDELEINMFGTFLGKIDNDLEHVRSIL